MSFFSIVSSSLSPALYLGSKATRSPRYPAAGQTPVPNVSLPLRFDWRDKHVVNQVRNQKMVSSHPFALSCLSVRQFLKVKLSQTCRERNPGGFLGQFIPQLSTMGEKAPWRMRDSYPVPTFQPAWVWSLICDHCPSACSLRTTSP